MSILPRTLRIAVQACVALALLTADASVADTTIQQTDAYRRIKAQVDKIRLVDTHEHLTSETARLKKPADCLAIMLHYVESDLVSAGLPHDPRPRNPKTLW
jgi:hypothetical protein